MDIVIREIKEKDYPAVTKLLINELWDNKINDDHVVPFFSKVKNNENYINFVALSDGCVVGFISAITFLWVASERNNMFIQGIVVQNEYQNKGVGTKLLKHLENYADIKGITDIGLCSGFQRTAAHAFYERNGYGKITQYFGKILNSIS